MNRRTVVAAVHGWVAEWSNAHAWKACLPQGNAGSNPAPSADLTDAPDGRIGSDLMKTSTSFFTAALALLFVAFSPAQAEPERPKTPLGEQMSAMATGLRKLRRESTDPAQKETALVHLAAIRENAAKAKTFEPAKTETIPTKEREKFVADYQAQIDELLAQFQKLEAAIRDGNTAEINTLFDGLQSFKRKSHERFNAEKD